MLGKDNLIGLVLLALGGVAIAALVYQISTGNRLTYNGPAWLPPIIAVVFMGAVFYGLFQSLRSRGREEWPHPGAGRKRWWDRWFGGKNDQPPGQS